jgi:hypothetical protein
MQSYCTLKLKVFFLLSLLIFLLTAYSLQLNATIRYVSKTGLSIPPYTTPENAADSIQKCINVSVFGDTIYVANGVYEEQVVMIPGLSLIGAGTDSCIVDSRTFPLTNNRTITMQNACLVKGFYIRTSNNFDYGQGIWTIGQTGLITQNKFSNANSGISLRQTDIQAYDNYFFNVRGGVSLSSSNSIVRKNVISITPYQELRTGIFISGISTIYKPLIDSNYIVVGVGEGINKSIGASATIKNNIIFLVDGVPDGILSRIDGNTDIFNNIIVAKVGYDGIYKNGSDVQAINNYVFGPFIDYGILLGPYDTLKNCVVTGADNGIGVWNNQNFTGQYNNSWNNNVNYDGFTPDTTNLSVDPMIVNDDTTQGDLDFHLQMYSPLIDAGDPTILDKESSRSDIGLYGGPYGESYVYIDLPPRTPVNLTANVDSLIKLNWNGNTEADFGYYNVFRDTTFNFTIDSTKLIASVTDTFYYQTFPSNVETLYYKLAAVDNQGNESEPSEQVYVKLVSVKNEWVPINNYILYQNYPNPFNPSTKISYKLKERGYVKLYVYDIKGELVSVLVNEVQESGYYEVGFSVGQESIPVLSSGVYIYQILVSDERSIPVFSDIKKMVYVK